ncbi:MAG TPA: single-stranded DNA-binding protein [Streptosporangiaceae bacterium]|nr:single-stranded DNA-binding protein [Streptosporangiaceae bacterium]
MINEAQVFLAGYVAREPRFRITTRGISSVSLRVACTPRWVDRESGEWTDGETSFVTVLCWRTLADNVAKCLHKGEPVLVKGRLHVRPYEKDGVSRLAVEIEATSVGHDLARGVASFQRPRRPAAENGAPANGAPANGAAGNGGAGNGGAGNAVLDGSGAEAGHPGGLGAEAGPDGTDAALAALSFAAQEARNGTDPALATPDEVAEPAGVSAPF